MIESYLCCRSVSSSFRYRKDELKELIDKTEMNENEIEEFYKDFLHCYPRGYLTLNKYLFIHQIKKKRQLNENEKIYFKEFFRLFDLNNDGKLDFKEFLLSIYQINSKSIEEKFLFICQFYSKEKKTKIFSRFQLKLFFEEIFHLFDIPLFHWQLEEFLHHLFNKIDNENKSSSSSSSIQWKQIQEILLHHQHLFQSILQPTINRSSSSSSIESIYHLSECF